ncbi:hypothetical protein DEJ48_38890 [Streptomyces venezuelae]|uniref:DUF6603 domain-containing protein n=1 Tax=Streptomyces venezuelae TaxID=54571 RepID=A0A5P2C781_STRVZ|nr:hypothetical protein DEJ48_38890 [Streptomyces venezuelae]
MSAQNFVGDVLGALAEAFEPLTDALASPEAAAAFLGRLGWSLSPTLPADAFTTAFGPLPGALTRLAERAAELAALPEDTDPLAVAAAIGKLGGAVADVVSALSALGPPAQGPPPLLDDPAFWNSLAQDVPNLLIARYLSRRQPKLWGLLRFTGIATAEVQPATPTRGSYRRDTVHWARVATLASDPGKLFAEVYGWGGTFDDVRFLTGLGELCACFGLPAGLGPAPSAALDPYWVPDAPARARIVQLDIPLHRDIVEAGPSVVMLLAALAVVPIPPPAAFGTSTADPVGFSVFPMVSGDLTETIRITDALSLSFTGGFEASGGIRVEIRPTGAGIATSGVTGRMAAAVRLDAMPALPWLLFGARDSTRMELGAAHLALGVRGTPPDLDIDIEAAADRVALVVDFGEGDGFLQKALGRKPLRFDFGAGVGWSRSAGFRFIGQATLDVTLAVHLSILGVVDVENIQVVLGVQPGTGRAALTVALSGRLSLGPVRAVVERVGLRAELEARRPPAPPGNLGGADLAFRFKAPDGAGLSLDATAVRGGGYIRLDEARGLYVGILQLEIQNRFTVTAIALITTKLPDGAPGFSLLVIIAAEFPGIQLGFVHPQRTGRSARRQPDHVRGRAARRGPQPRPGLDPLPQGPRRQRLPGHCRCAGRVPGRSRPVRHRPHGPPRLGNAHPDLPRPRHHPRTALPGTDRAPGTSGAGAARGRARRVAEDGRRRHPRLRPS